MRATLRSREVADFLRPELTATFEMSYKRDELTVKRTPDGRIVHEHRRVNARVGHTEMSYVMEETAPARLWPGSRAVMPMVPYTPASPFLLPQARMRIEQDHTAGTSKFDLCVWRMSIDTNITSRSVLAHRRRQVQACVWVMLFPAMRFGAWFWQCFYRKKERGNAWQGSIGFAGLFCASPRHVAVQGDFLTAAMNFTPSPSSAITTFIAASGMVVRDFVSRRQPRAANSSHTLRIESEDGLLFGK